jgi:hypothetical protein
MNKFFLTGPNRTGTTLLARCIDDHPNCICLSEINIQQKVFGGPSTVGHSGQMKRHGFVREETDSLLSGIVPKDQESFFSWYDQCAEILKSRYEKPELSLIGDKNPYFHKSKGCIEAMRSYLKIWTIRDPRAVWYSGVTHKLGRKDFLSRYIDNVRFFMNRLDDNTLVVRFEDLVKYPEKLMRKVYDFLGVKYDKSYLTRSPQKHDTRFKWNPNSMLSFDPKILDKWTRDKKRIRTVKDFTKPEIKWVMEKFGYEVF